MVKSVIRAASSLALALGLLATPALAQGVLPAFPAPTVTVDPAKPFGDLDVAPAHSLQAKAIVAWVAKLTSAQQTDLVTRCDYMLGRAGEYRVDDLTFCQQWQFGRSPSL